MSTGSDSVELKIPAKPEYVGVARLFISGLANRMGFSYEAIEDLKVAVAEACTNVVQHAYRNEEGDIILECTSYVDRLEILVIDHGQSFNIEEIKGELGPIDQGQAVEHLSEGGLGLFLIETLMDEVQIQSNDGVIIMMTKYKNKDGVLHDRPIHPTHS